MNLTGITRRPFGANSPIQNPGPHWPAKLQNRVIIEKISPDGAVARVVREGNVMATYGLDSLCSLLATGTQAFSDQTTKGWVQCMAIGTHTTAAASTRSALGASTATVLLSEASMAVSDLGARTLEYRGTFDDANAYEINEVGLFGTQNAAGGSMVAHSVLAATDSVNKGTGDTVNVSYQIIFTTA